MTETVPVLPLLRSAIDAEATVKHVQDRAGDVVRMARRQLGMTQRQLATRLVCDVTYISKIENGHVRAGIPFLRKLTTLVEEQHVS